MPVLSGISVDGAAIPNFNPATHSYTVEIPDTFEKLPKITATTDKGNISITYAKDEKGVSQIKVSTGEYIFSNYYIGYKMIATKPDLNTSLISTKATSCGPTPFLNLPFKRTAIISGMLIS